MDAQALANDVGATLRAAEAAVIAGDTTVAATVLGELHEQLGKVYHVVNDYRDRLGEYALDWDQIAGNGTGSKGAQTHSGGTGKGPPPNNP